LTTVQLEESEDDEEEESSAASPPAPTPAPFDALPTDPIPTKAPAPTKSVNHAMTVIDNGNRVRKRTTFAAK